MSAARSELALREPAPGVFVFDCTYNERHIPKNARFRWHPGPKCKTTGCAACAADLGQTWWTASLEAAVVLVEHADPELTESLRRRAAPLVEATLKRTEAERTASRVQKLQRMVSVRASHAADAKIAIPAPEGRSYLPYQRACVAYALGRPSTLIADEMGLGKTVEALAVVNADPKVAEVLIVCPASLELNWERECQRWLVRDLGIGIARKAFPVYCGVVIVNYNMLGKWERSLRRKWDVLIVDECHYVKNKTAQRSKRVFELEAERKLFLTGTPILNRPAELFPILSHLAPDDFPKFWDYAARFCAPMQTNFGWDVSGASNLDQLHELLRGTVMVRRTKADVLKDLPPKRRQVIEVSSEAAAKLIRAERAAFDRHREQLDRLRSARHAADVNDDKAARSLLRKEAAVAFGELSKLRHATALTKVPLVVEHLQSVLEETPKVVVFAHHRDVIDGLAREFAGRCVTLTGDMPAEARQSAVDRFQSDPETALFIGSITAAGVGLTLTAAAHVVFAELDWVPANMTQAEDRTHRIGQRDSVLVQHIVLQDSLDAGMARTLIRKQAIIDGAVDGAEREGLFEGAYAEALLEAATRMGSEDAPGPAEDSRATPDGPQPAASERDGEAGDPPPAKRARGRRK